MKKILPSLADLQQDIAGKIPIAIIKEWVESEQTPEDHERILAPYKKQGIMISSDAAGLSRLSAGKSLIEVMKLVSDPKETIFSYGKAIGGQAVGVWAADNTQMFYSEEISPTDVVLQMIAAQKYIQKHLSVRCGIGIHKGSTYEIGGGLYGAAADHIEEYTEDESNADEIIVSKEVLSELNSVYTVKEERDGMHILDYDAVEVNNAMISEDVYYPAPFDRAFHDALIGLDLSDEGAVKALHVQRVKETTIVLFRSFLPEQERLLDRFTDQAIVDNLVHSVVRNYDARVVKSNGMLAIISCEKVGEGADLGMALMQAAKENEIEANIGVSRGEVLIFELEDKTADLAGGPVNLSSKLAEDSDERGKIYLEGVEAEHAKRHGLTNAFERKMSGVQINGIMN